MKIIRLATWIDAPVERCFKLSLSVDLHLAIGRSIGERVTSGMRSGLLGLNDTVTWSGRHFGLEFRHRSMIDQCRPFLYFRDVMVDGMFERFQHEHHFAVMDDGTRMRDEVRFSMPGLAGLAAEPFVRRYLVRLLKQRNAVIRQVAQSREWVHFLEGAEPRKASATMGVESHLPASVLYRA